MEIEEYYPDDRFGFSTVIEDYLQNIRNGAVPGVAANMLGFDTETLIRYRKEHPEFVAREKHATKDLADKVLQVQVLRAFDGNIDAAKLVLPAIDPGTHGTDKQQEKFDDRPVDDEMPKGIEATDAKILEYKKKLLAREQDIA